MTGPVEESFDLLERPWILVQRVDGGVEEVALLDLFARAHELRSVLGELPTQTFAIIRLLLAILHRATAGQHTAMGPATPEEWAALWQQPTLPTEAIGHYLTYYRDRFDLLSPTTPFYQVADLHTAKGEHSSLHKLIADVPVNAYFFTTRLKSGVDRLSFAEAARWVVHCQAFDPSGIKSGAADDRRVKGGKGYPIGTGWGGQVGGVLVEGATLRETLLLNLLPAGTRNLTQSPEDSPAWERAPFTGAAEFDDEPEPAGPLQLYTWQSRRMRLFHEGDGVHGVLIANGDKLAPQNRHHREPMSLWRRSQAQEKKLGSAPIYMPQQHDPERSVWRGLGALLTDTWQSVQSKEAAARLRPLVLNWLDQAQAHGVLDPDYQLRTRTIGMLYGSQSATTAEIIDDAVAVAVILLGDAGRELRQVAEDAVSDAEAGAQALGYLAGNLALAAGGDAAGPQDRAREMAYAELDRPFRRWLAELSPDSDPESARTGWQRTAATILRRLGRELVEQAGPAAWRGRMVHAKNKDIHVSTAEADLVFRDRLRKVFPHAYQDNEVAA